MLGRRGTAAMIVGAISIALVLSVVGGAIAAGSSVQTKLSGKDEPHDADPDGSGDFNAKLKKKKKKVCFNVSFQNIQDPYLAHIHQGKKNEAGPPVITLFDVGEGSSLPSPISSCVKPVKKRLIKAIKGHPQDYYMNLHNTEYPDGAIRGQLKPG
jgi:hypothetical protein